MVTIEQDLLYRIKVLLVLRDMQRREKERRRDRGQSERETGEGGRSQ